MIIWFHIYEYLGKTNREQISGFLALEVQSGNWLQRNMKEIFGMMEMFYILIVVDILEYTFSKCVEKHA